MRKKFDDMRGRPGRRWGADGEFVDAPSSHTSAGGIFHRALQERLGPAAGCRRSVEQFAKTFPLPWETGSYFSDLPGWKQYGTVGLATDEPDVKDDPVIHVDSVVAGFLLWRQEGKARQGSRTDLHPERAPVGVQVRDVSCPTIIITDTPRTAVDPAPTPPPRGFKLGAK
jgi:hypothetical protein